MPTAYQLPVRSTKARPVGFGMWRKQLLPVGSIEYDGGRLDFTPDYLATLVKSFNEKAFDQVALQFADADNAHTVDPERFRGEVKALELANDGLYGLIAPTEAGAQALRDNPRLGVSVRIKEGMRRADGRTFPAAIHHVLGTLDPRVVAMKPWQQVDLAAGDETEVVDLTAATFTKGRRHMAGFRKQQKDDDAALSKEDVVKLRELLAKLDGKDNSKGSDDTASDDDDLDISDEELERLIQEALIESDTDTVGTGSAATAGADLANAGDRVVDVIARAQLGQQSVDLAAVQTELDAEKWRNERQTWLHRGVPPAILDLAEQMLKSRPGSLDLANGSSVDVGAVVRKMLHEAEGIVDLSQAVGSGDGDENTKVDGLLKAWDAQAYGY